MMIIKNKKGFSIMEIMVSITLLVIISFLSYSFFTSGTKALRFESEQSDAIREARRAMNIIEKDIRMISSSALGSYPIESANPQELIVYSDIIEETGYVTEKIHFFVDGPNLKKTVTQFNQITRTYDLSPATTTVANYLNNELEPIFKYYDNDGASTNHINDIRRIGFSLKINVTPNIQPNDYYVESDVTLRNLKDNL